MMQILVIFWSLIFSSSWTQATPPIHPYNAVSLKSATRHLFANISRSDTLPGTVVASPSRYEPNYYFHWVRDASLVMITVHELFQDPTFSPSEKSYDTWMRDFINLSALQQNTQNRSGGLGEPKFNIDGTAYNNDWGRPQNDGPALRAIALISVAQLWLSQNRGHEVRSLLYDSRLPSQSVIKRDLEYVAHHWKDLNFDIWEEVYGRHFYTLMVQRKALMLGAQLAKDLDDPGAASFYQKQAQSIQRYLVRFWDTKRGYIVAMQDHPQQRSGLDVAVVLAALHGQMDGAPFDLLDDRILATVIRLRQSFDAIYEINRRPDFAHLGSAIGRYPEDTYDGYRTDARGNPWFLATAAYAEFYFRLRDTLQTEKQILITSRNCVFFSDLLPSNRQKLMTGQIIPQGSALFTTLMQSLSHEGQRFVARIQAHSGPAGTLSEQFHHAHGYMQGAQDLTWSYAGIISALKASSQPPLSKGDL